jgi:hypothetical protein
MALKSGFRLRSSQMTSKLRRRSIYAEGKITGIGIMSMAGD